MIDDNIFEVVYDLKVVKKLDWDTCSKALESQYRCQIPADALKSEVDRYFKTMTGIAPFTETCPACGSAVKIRQGPYGFFIGCSAYPGCNFKAVRGSGIDDWG